MKGFTWREWKESFGEEKKKNSIRKKLKKRKRTAAFFLAAVSLFLSGGGSPYGELQAAYGGESGAVTDIWTNAEGEFRSLPGSLRETWTKNEGDLAEHLTYGDLFLDGTPSPQSTEFSVDSPVTIRLEWKLEGPDLMRNKGFQYSFPPGITVENTGTQEWTDQNGEKKGTLSVQNNVLFIDYDHYANSVETGIELKARWNQEAVCDSVTIPWNQELYTTLSRKESEIQVRLKPVEEAAEEKEDGSLIWVYRAIVSAEHPAKEVILTDTLISTSGRFQFCRGYFRDSSGEHFDYRRRTGTDAKGKPVYQYGNFEGAVTQPRYFWKDGFQSRIDGKITFPPFSLAEQEEVHIEYAVKLHGKERQELDKNQTAEKVTNTLTAVSADASNGPWTAIVSWEDIYQNSRRK